MKNFMVQVCHKDSNHEKMYEPKKTCGDKVDVELFAKINGTSVHVATVRLVPVTISGLVQYNISFEEVKQVNGTDCVGNMQVKLWREPVEENNGHS